MDEEEFWKCFKYLRLCAYTLDLQLDKNVFCVSTGVKVSSRHELDLEEISEFMNECLLKYAATNKTSQKR